MIEMIKNKKKIVLTSIFSLLVLVIFCCGCSNGKLNEKSDKASVEESSVEESSDEDYSYDEDEDYSDEEIPEDCGYDDVGGTPEEQEQYASQDSTNNISEVNQSLRNYLVSLMNQAFGYNVGGHIRVNVATNDTSATIKIYLADIKTPEDRNIAIQSCQESDLNSLHDGILNTYSNYGFSINNLDLRLCDTFGVIILQSQGGNMNSSDKYIDLGL